jgi:uncharacterized protein
VRHYRPGNYLDKLVVVTGASSGIGFALAERLLKEGARVVLVADNGAKLAQAAHRLRELSEATDAIVCDIADTSAVRAMAAQVLQSHGCPDILINCAGFATYRTFEEATLEEIVRVADVNFIGALRCTKVFLDGMIRRGSGQIVNICSIAGVVPMTPNGTYSSAKHGMRAWSEVLHQEVARFGIGVTVVYSGRVATSFFDHETFRQRTPPSESRLLVPMPVMVESILDAVARRQLHVFVPKYWRFLAWGLAAFPLLLQPAYRRIVRRRIELHYADRALREGG